MIPARDGYDLIRIGPEIALHDERVGTDARIRRVDAEVQMGIADL